MCLAGMIKLLIDPANLSGMIELLKIISSSDQTSAVQRGWWAGPGIKEVDVRYKGSNRQI